MTPLIKLTDQPYKNATKDTVANQEIDLSRFCGPASLGPNRLCLRIYVGTENGTMGESIYLTRLQAQHLCEVIKQNICEFTSGGG